MVWKKLFFVLLHLRFIIDSDEDILTMKTPSSSTNKSNKPRLKLSESLPCTKDETDLRTRRAKKKMPTGVAASVFSLPYSFNQRAEEPQMDLTDDSESSSHTLADSLFHAPRAFGYAAGFICACMVSMVLLAVQGRVLKTPWVDPSKWIPRLAIVVVASLIVGLVVGCWTRTDFVRKRRSKSTERK